MQINAQVAPDLEIRAEIERQENRLSGITARAAAIEKRAAKIRSRNPGAGISALQRVSFMKVLISIIKPYLDNLTTTDKDGNKHLTDAATMLSPIVLASKIAYVVRYITDASNDGRVTEKVIQLAKCDVGWDEEIPLTKSGNLDARFKPVKFTISNTELISVARFCGYWREKPRKVVSKTVPKNPTPPIDSTMLALRQRERQICSFNRRAIAFEKEKEDHMKRVKDDKGCHIRARNAKIHGTHKGDCMICDAILKGDKPVSNRMKRMLRHTLKSKPQRIYRKRQPSRIVNDVSTGDLPSDPTKWDDDEKQWLSANTRISAEIQAKLRKKGHELLVDIINQNQPEKPEWRSRHNGKAKEANLLWIKKVTGPSR